MTISQNAAHTHVGPWSFQRSFLEIAGSSGREPGPHGAVLVVTHGALLGKTFRVARAPSLGKKLSNAANHTRFTGNRVKIAPVLLSHSDLDERQYGNHALGSGNVELLVAIFNLAFLR